MFTFSHRLVHNTPCWWCCKSSFFLIWICICNTVSTQYTTTEVFFLLWHFWNSLTRICPRCFLNTFTSLHSLTRLKHFEMCKLGYFTGQNRLGCSSYLIQDIKMYPCAKSGAFITIWTLHRLSTSTSVIFTFTLQYAVHIPHIRRSYEGVFRFFVTFQMNPLVAIITFQPITLSILIFCFIKAKYCCTWWIMLVTVP